MRLHLHVEVTGRSVVVVGGGGAGVEKVQRLVHAGAEVTVIDPSPSADLAAAARVVRREFQAGDVLGAWLVVVATGDAGLNDAVQRAADAAGIWVNRADLADGGGVTFGAVVRRGYVEVGVTTGGASPSLARWVRDRVESALPAEVGDLAEILAGRARRGGRRGHRGLAFDDALAALEQGDRQRAVELVDADSTQVATNAAIAEGSPPA